MFELAATLAIKVNKKSNLSLMLGPLLIIASLAIALFKSYLNPNWGFYWTLGIITSLTASFCITAASYREAAEFLSEQQRSIERVQQELRALQKEHSGLILRAHHESEQARLSLESYRERLKEAMERSASFEELANLKKYSWDALEGEKEVLFQENVSLSQDVQVLKAEAARLRERLEQSSSLPVLPHPYDELRKQFDEKVAVLNETRKELFALEGEYLTLKKEMEETLLDRKRDDEVLLKEYDALVNYCMRLKVDLEAHQELITELSIKKTDNKLRKKVTKKVKIDETTVADLFTK